MGFQFTFNSHIFIDNKIQIVYLSRGGKNGSKIPIFLFFIITFDNIRTSLFCFHKIVSGGKWQFLDLAFEER